MIALGFGYLPVFVNRKRVEFYLTLIYIIGLT